MKAGDEEDCGSHRGRQEERETPAYAMEEDEALEVKSGGGHSVSEEGNLSDTASGMGMGNDEKPAVSSSSGKNEGTSKRPREVTKEEEEYVPVDNQSGGDKAAFTKPPSMEEKGLTAEALTPSRYFASTDKDTRLADPSAKTPPIEVDSDDSDKDGEKY